MSTDQTTDAIERVEELLERLAMEIGIDATVEVRDEGDALVGEFVGDDLGLVIGRHGETIDAIQHLAYRVAYRGDRGDRKRVVIDAAGYRERRATALRATADQAAEVAARDGKAVALDPMSALERKVVHEHLKSRHDIETYSEGQEPTRRLVVAPVVE
jgi:spoIIIJ-associated protein